MSGLTGSKVGVNDERKDDFEEDHPTSQHAFENLIGMRESYIDQSQKGTMSQERQRKLTNCLF